MHNDIFEYSYIPNNHALYLNIRPKIANKNELYDAYSLYFPDYFGRNWDAFWDCVCDFSWESSYHIYIVHTDVPLLEQPAALQTYLEILCDAICSWKNYPLSNGFDPRVVLHELHVVFPENCRETVEPIMRAYVLTETHKRIGLHER